MLLTAGNVFQRLHQIQQITLLQLCRSKQLSLCYQTAKLATVDFKVADQKISTDNLEIEGSGFSLFGAGDIFFVTDKMDMSVRINAHGIPGIVLFPVSKLFEFKLKGTTKNPVWYPVNFSSDLFDRMSRGGRSRDPEKADPADE